MSTQVKTEEKEQVVINDTRAISLSETDKQDIEKTFSEAKDFRSL